MSPNSRHYAEAVDFPVAHFIHFNHDLILSFESNLKSLLLMQEPRLFGKVGVLLSRSHVI
jgi:hypothetical protein